MDGCMAWTTGKRGLPSTFVTAEAVLAIDLIRWLTFEQLEQTLAGLRESSRYCLCQVTRLPGRFTLQGRDTWPRSLRRQRLSSMGHPTECNPGVHFGGFEDRVSSGCLCTASRMLARLVLARNGLASSVHKLAWHSLLGFVCLSHNNMTLCLLELKGTVPLF